MAKRYPKPYYSLGPWGRRVWREPWRYKGILPRRRLRRALDAAGLITPHFSWDDAACHDGTRVPASLRKNAIKQAWKLERFRHALGDRPMPILSWYRHPAYNKKVGGAVASQHLNAGATDFPSSFVNAVGRGRFFREAERIWKNDGIGDYPSGSAHTDSRGFRARWSAFVGQ